MKLSVLRGIVLVAALLLSSVLFAQKPGGVRSSATPVALPSSYTNTNINYVRTWEPDMPLSDTGAVISTTRKVREVKQTTQYLDGLGRPVQTVVKGISANGKDMVQTVVYDEFGRQQYQYLPYADQSSADGRFKTDPFTTQSNFYKNGVLNPGVIGENIFYSKTDFETSPLNRVLKTYAPGNSWSGKPLETRYLVNVGTDSVRLWNIGSGFPVSTGYYSAGQLYKTVSIGEQQNQVVEYKDKDGHVVLKKVQIADAPAAGAYGWLCTYYIYDDLGNLRYVIPPQGVESIKNNWTVTTAVDTGLCYQYQYDGRQRMIMKRIPGSGRVFMVYDIRDRLVFIQDSVQRSKSPMEWMVTFYDELNRPTMTGIYKHTISADSLQKRMNAVTGIKSVAYTAPGKEDLYVYAHEGNTSYTATKSISLLEGFDTGLGAETVAEINPSAGETITIIASNPLPDIAASLLTPLTYTFYDNYDYEGKLAFVGTDTTKLQAADTLYPDRRPITGMTNGLVTGTKVRVLGTDKWLTTTTYYNDKGRAVQVIAENNLGGKDVVSTLYNYKGLVLSTYLRHQNPQSIIPQTTLMTSMAYDHGGRLLTVKKRLNDDVSQEKTIAANSYDELGQLRLKRLGVTASGSLLDTLNYTYNIRGWLQGINRNFVNSGNTTSNWFGQELSYDYGFTANQFNGNIAGVKWKTRADSAFAYGYSYDKANRLTGASFTQRNGTSWAQGAKDFSVNNLSYDANGNIKTMLQKGMVGTTSKTIDSLVYTYPSNSNRLLGVRDIDSSITKSAQLGDFIDGNTSVKDYAYDANGNMIADLNKRISSITYNHLNLPSVITIAGKGTITYLYDALGNKLSKTVIDNTGSTVKTTVTDYDGVFVYKQDSLELISHEEGRIRTVYKTGNPVAYAYDYFEKDHLGNVRTVLTEQTDFTMYAATMETNAAVTEAALFSNIEETRVEKPSGYPQDATTQENKYVARLNGKAEGKKIGPSLVLRVMAGDTVQISTRAFYKSNGPKDNSQKAPLEDMLAGLVQAFGSSTGENGIHDAALFNGTPFDADFYGNTYQRLKEKEGGNGQSDRPKAYLNFVLFDDDFKLVEKNSGVRQVKSSADELQELGVEKMPVAKSGYLYVYTSNESQRDVYFDNVVLGLNSGPLLEETHYYPFGLTMAGISINTINPSILKNKLKYNDGSELQNEEFSDGSGLELYGTRLRTLDPQLGRFWQIDPRPNPANSLYASMENNPVRFNDPFGDSIIPKVTYDYSMTANPVALSDLGSTTLSSIDITSASSINIDISLNFTISLSAAFNGPTLETNIEKQNPGLEREVNAHEEGHKDQLLEAAITPVTISVNIDGNSTSFTGQADQVIVNATAAFNSSNAAAGMNADQRSAFVNNNIGAPALSAMNNNITAAENASNKEADANIRAARTLGASTIKYSNGNTPVIYQNREIR